ncbi:multivesicular body subunit 12B [Anopheles arabiensis]|uniref:multivesicular body subunit 12B n=1 Tax=Anopheles arabiensis TaxID=7173 RepID=UPI001AAD8C7E|nr:multivesicular body subunit 12B [Anopheles arabiensis]XP_318149.5 multivesicular body subunit 12B isoform X2 [Anopheles gambiae]
MMKSSTSHQKNILNTVICVLPDNRPVTSLQLVEEFEKCPTNFQPINKTYDQDQDADLWREKMLIGKRTTRYLCQSKSEGLPGYIVETLKIINEKEIIPEGFSQLTRTADTEQKAWRKKQLVYRLTKKSSAKQAVTDIILCSRMRQAPDGFTLAGDINGILVCFKKSPVPHRPSPSIPSRNINDLEKTIENLKLQVNCNNALFQSQDYEYVQLSSSYKLSPKRAAPKPLMYSTGTMYVHTDVEGVPFLLNPGLKQYNTHVPIKYDVTGVQLQYDFQLERQVLCTTKSQNDQVTNPFFQ